MSTRLWREIFAIANVEVSDAAKYDNRSFGRVRYINRHDENKNLGDDGYFPYSSHILLAPTPFDDIIAGEQLFIDLNRDGAINFHGGRSTLRNPDVARTYLGLAVDYIMRYLGMFPNKNLYLIGSIASDVPVHTILIDHDGHDADNRPWGNRLSYNRAEVIRSLLVELGVPADRLIPMGFGASVPIPPRRDEWARGHFYEGEGQFNRTVFLISDNTDLFEALRSVTRVYGVSLD